jgi:hypothetical protein
MTEARSVADVLSEHVQFEVKCGPLFSYPQSGMDRNADDNADRVSPMAVRAWFALIRSAWLVW